MPPSQRVQERRDFHAAHVLRVPLVMKENEAPYPVDVDLFGSKTVMFAADRVAQLIEKAWFELKLGLEIGHTNVFRYVSRDVPAPLLENKD